MASGDETEGTKRRKTYMYRHEEFVVPKSTLWYQNRRRQDPSALRDASNAQTSKDLASPSTSALEKRELSIPAEIANEPEPSEEMEPPCASDVKWPDDSPGSDTDLEDSVSIGGWSSDDLSAEFAEVRDTNSSMCDSEGICDFEDSAGTAAARSPSCCADDSFHFRCEDNSAEDASSLPNQEDLITRCLDEFGDSTLPHSNTTKVEAVAMLMSFVRSHGLTWSALDDLLKIINECFGGTDVIPGSKYLFRKLWSPKTTAATQKHYYCDTEKCTGLLKGDATSLNMSCEKCKKVYSLSALDNTSSFFTLLDIRQQVDQAISTSKLEIAKRLEEIETAIGSQSISDIIDGRIYQDMKRKGILGHQDLTLTISTDGSPVFKSSRCSIWPIQFVMNELPPRTRLQNTVLAGLWFGKKHPNMELFIGKFASTVVNMGPVKWKTGTGDYMSKIHLICCSADSPARAAVQNHVLYSGYFGCPWCTIRGKHSGGSIRYTLEEDELPEERTAEQVLRDTAYAEMFRKPVQGVKGASALARVPNFNPVWGYPVDYMHCVLLGVTRQLTEHLLSSSNSEEPFYVGRPCLLNAINKRLLSIRPPNSFTRLPRSLSERALWKASEWRHWLLFYWLPCMVDISPLRFWKHVRQLSEAVHILLRTEISPSLIDHAESLLRNFVSQMEVHYGDTSMTFNVHLLLHLDTTVRSMGPLWAHSMFAFESGNGHLLKTVTAAKGVPQQIVERAVMGQELTNLLQATAISTKVKELCDSILHVGHIQHATYMQGACFLGSSRHVSYLTEDEVDAMVRTFGVRPSLMAEHDRFVLDGQLLHTASYARAKRRNSSVIQCWDKRMGIITRAMRVKVGGGEEAILLCKELVCQGGTSVFPPHIKEATNPPGTTLMAVRLEDVDCVCLYINLEGVSYVCHLPNNVERD